eukprot:XP_005639701.1 uncharacterized protein LOC102151137 [Canis lupus familiaris]
MKRAIRLGIQMTVGSPQQKVSKKTPRHTAISGNEFSQQPKGREPGSGLFPSWALDENTDHQHLNHASSILYPDLRTEGSSQPQRTVALPRREESRAQPRPSGPLPSSEARRPPSPARARVARPCGSRHPFCAACNTLPPRTHPQGSLGRPLLRMRPPEAALPAPRPPASLQRPGRLREAPPPPPPPPPAGSRSALRAGAPHTRVRGRGPGRPGGTGGRPPPRRRHLPCRRPTAASAATKPPPGARAARPATGSRSPPLPGRCLGYPGPAPRRPGCGAASAQAPTRGVPGTRGRGGTCAAALQPWAPREARGSGPRCGRWA